jgi:hypothetical protein
MEVRWETQKIAGSAAKLDCGIIFDDADAGRSQQNGHGLSDGSFRERNAVDSGKLGEKLNEALPIWDGQRHSDSLLDAY